MNDHIFLIVKVIVSLENLQTKISDTGHPNFILFLLTFFKNVVWPCSKVQYI